MSAVWRSASRSRSTQPAPNPGAMAMIVDCSCVEEDVRAASSRNRPDASLVASPITGGAIRSGRLERNGCLGSA